MALTVLYFARLRERLGLAQEDIALQPNLASVGDLLNYLRARGPQWQAALGDERVVRVAVNQDLVQSDTRLKDGDEVALFPPVTGG
jgi:molybdopterin synthase sulfur carrier subunit